jgi:hypothetical protein
MIKRRVLRTFLCFRPSRSCPVSIMARAVHPSQPIDLALDSGGLLALLERHFLDYFTFLFIIILSTTLDFMPHDSHSAPSSGTDKRRKFIVEVHSNLFISKAELRGVCFHSTKNLRKKEQKRQTTSRRLFTSLLLAPRVCLLCRALWRWRPCHASRPREIKYESEPPIALRRLIRSLANNDWLGLR